MTRTLKSTAALVRIGILITVLLVASEASSSVGTTFAESSGPEMALSITDGEAWFCFDTDCYVETDSSFELTVDVVEAPEDGYVLFQTAIDFGIYDPSASEDGAGAAVYGVDPLHPAGP